MNASFQKCDHFPTVAGVMIQHTMNIIVYVKLPFTASHEMMWRDDGAYDLVVPLGYNDMPASNRVGEVPFFCIALQKENLYGGLCSDVA